MLTKIYTDNLGERVRFEREFLTDEDYTKAMNAMVVVCADIIPVLPDGRIILATRRNKPAAYVWEFGGRVLPGETYEEAAVRKFRQETGVTIAASNLTLLGCPRYFWPERQQEPQNRPCDCLVFTFSVPMKEDDIAAINAHLDPNEYVAGSARAYSLEDLRQEYAHGNLHAATLDLYQLAR